jgi:mRNA-capping enzyme
MDTLLKWKFTHLNSVDFLLKLVWVPGSGAAPAPRLYVGAERGEVIPVDEPSGEFTLGGVDHPDRAPDGTQLSDLDGQIVECTWDKEGGGEGVGAEGGGGGAWRYLRVRSDKDMPNFVTVYRHTLQSILDDITSEEIIEFVGEVVQRRQQEQQQQLQQGPPP